MIRPVIKNVSSVDWTGEPFPPSQAACVWFHLEIGEHDRAAADLFQIGVCNRQWALENALLVPDILKEGAPYFVDKHILLNESPSLGTLKEIIDLVIISNGPYKDWREFGNKMEPYLLWEFAN
jgi:hypothetical protein